VTPIAQELISDDTPLRLARAAELAFPGGGMTAKGLRREAERGRLVIERIAGKDFTTLRAIADMRKLCRVVPKSRSESPPTSLRPDASLCELSLQQAQRRLEAKINGPIDLKDRRTGKWASDDAKNKARRMGKRERDALKDCYEARGSKLQLARHWHRTAMWLVLHGLIRPEGYNGEAKRLYSITATGETEWLRINSDVP
jgi:hypothetical protein